MRLLRSSIAALFLAVPLAAAGQTVSASVTDLAIDLAAGRARYAIVYANGAPFEDQRIAPHARSQRLERHAVDGRRGVRLGDETLVLAPIVSETVKRHRPRGAREQCAPGVRRAR